MILYLHNSLSGKKEEFQPLDPFNVRMYVCGPTVYDRPHIGNARAVVVYDVLYRLLKTLYPKVTYARNITDVDDKINAAAKKNGESITNLTERVIGWFHADMAALNNLKPDFEPKATAHIADIIELIKRIIANGHAYISEGHVLFDVESIGQRSGYYYGLLSGKKIDELIAGARIEVESYKKSPEDFVLWKPSSKDELSWDSPWGCGRPGWHIECSAMSSCYLGEDFDIHGGGADLKFPHHENEIAQSRCGNEGSRFAKYWVHNGFLTVNGEKMSKSLGNFITVRELLDRGIDGEVIRYVLLATHYSKPLDFNNKALDDGKKFLDRLYHALQLYEEKAALNVKPDLSIEEAIRKRSQNAYAAFFEALKDDLNTPKAFAELYIMAKGIRSVNATQKLVEQFKECAHLLGLLEKSPEQWFNADTEILDVAKIEELITQRATAKKNKNWSEADRIREELVNMGVILEDSPTGTKWRKG